MCGWVCAYSDSMLVVPDVVGSDGWVVAIVESVPVLSIRLVPRRPYLTCSETKCVVPASSSHRPRYSSPKNGFSGFFSDPSFSLRLAYEDFKVLRNHFRTRRARFCGSGSDAGATKIEGCSTQ